MAGEGANVAGEGADAADVDRQGAKSEESNGGAEIKILEVWNLMQLFAQSTNRL